MKQYKTGGRLHVGRTLTQMLISYFIIILLSISTISVVLYYKFSTATIEDIRNNMQDKLAQNMNQLELIRSQVYALGLQLLNDSVLVDAMYRTESDEVAKYLATRKLMQVKDANPMILSVSVYNSKTGQLVSNFGVSDKAGNSAVAELAKDADEIGRAQFIPFTYTYKSDRGETVTEQTISFLFTDSTQLDSPGTGEKDGKSDSCIIISLNAEKIQKSFTALDYSKNSQMYLLHKNGDVICDSDFSNFGGNIAGDRDIAAVLKSTERTGYLITSENGSQSLITYYSSPNIPFLFVSKSNYSVLLEKVYALRMTIIIICVLIFMVCVAIAILAAYNVYLPFGKLVNTIKWQLSSEGDGKADKRTYNEIEYLTKAFSNIISKTNELELSMQENVPLLKRMFLKGLLGGDIISQGEAANKLTDLKFNPAGRLCVVLFSIDGYSKLSKLESDFARYNIRLNIENIINGKLSGGPGMESVEMEDDLTAVILNADGAADFAASMLKPVSEIQEEVSRELGITVTAAIGLTVEGIENLCLSCSNCLELLKYRFVYGYNTILDNNMIQVSVNKKYTYIEKEKKKILQALKACDREQTEAEIGNIITLVTDNQYDYIRLTMNQLALDITKSMESLFDPEDNDINFNNIYSNLNSMDTLEEVGEWLVLYCGGIMQKLEGKKDNKHKDMIVTALSYLEANFNKPDLSTELLAGIVNLTPGYFGKLFSDHMGKTVNEYVIELRMRKAKELLENSCSPVSDISSEVGYTNQSYFTSIFKKYFGMTPNQYRIDHKKTKCV